MEVNNILNKVILIVSHRRSGTHLTIDALCNNSEYFNKRYLTLDRIFDGHPSKISLDDLLQNIKNYSIIKTHLNYTFNTRIKIGEISNLNDQMDYNKREFLDNLISKSKIIYVYRDGRDVMVSLYHYIKELKDLDYNLDFFSHLQKQLPYWVKHIKSWINVENILKVSFEDFAFSYNETLEKCFNYIGLKLPGEILNVYGAISSIKNKNKVYRFINLLLTKLGFKPRLSAIRPRKGEVGGWESYFKDREKDYFKEIAGDLLIKLGYENNYNW